MHGFFRLDVNQISQMIANRALAIFIKRGGKPKGPAIRQRTEAGIDVVKTRIDQLDGDDEATEEIGDGAVRIDVGAKFVAAKKHIAAKERVAFAFEIKILRQLDDIVAVLFHPTGEVRRFARSFFVAKITRNKAAADREPGIGRENHVR